jgi:hypothetical protein
MTRINPNNRTSSKRLDADQVRHPDRESKSPAFVDADAFDETTIGGTKLALRKLHDEPR